jgi:hypothetical protein
VEFVRFRRRAHTVELKERNVVIVLSRLAILSEQHLLVPGESEAAQDVLQATADGLQDLDVSGLYWAIESVESGGLLGLFRPRHDYLVVGFGREFPEHYVLVGCSALGSSTLQVSLLVAATERLTRRIWRAFRFGGDPKSRDEVGRELGSRAGALAVRTEAVRFCLNEALSTIASIGEATGDVTFSELYTKD